MESPSAGRRLATRNSIRRLRTADGMVTRQPPSRSRWPDMPPCMARRGKYGPFGSGEAEFTLLSAPGGHSIPTGEALYFTGSFQIISK